MIEDRKEIQSTAVNIKSRGGSTLTSTLTKQEELTESLTKPKTIEAESDLFITKRDGRIEALNRNKVSIKIAITKFSLHVINIVT